MNCNTPTDATFSFSGFSQRGGVTDHHSDGWGIAFKTATLKDEDVQVNFAEQTNPSDRVAVVVTAPLTLDEPWTAFVPGEVMVFREGVLI
jgi:predicted glutamine amidotransferase